MVLGAVIVFLTFISGDYLLVFSLKKNFGEILPITILIYGLIVYFSGLFRALNIGIIIVAFATVFSFVYGTLISLKLRQFQKCFSRFFNITFFVFTLIFIVLMFGDYGQLVTGTDDPGHWIDCVKVMTYSGEFYTNPIYHSSFPTYPPMMAIIQLLIQKEYMFLSGKEFCEWLMFITYHLTAISLFFPFLAYINRFRRFIRRRINRHWKFWTVSYSILFLFSLCISITIFFRRVFFILQIDAFLACEAATIFTLIFYKDRINYSDIYLCLLLFSTTLTKELGLLFSGFGLLLLVVDHDTSHKNRFCLLSAICIMFSKISWNLMIRIDGAVDPKPNSVNWIKYLKVISGFEKYVEDYKNDSISAFKKALLDRFITFGNDELHVKYIVVLICLLFLSVFLVFFFGYDKRLNVVLSISFLCFLFYYIGLGGVYVDKFIYTEAVGLASFERYTNSLLCMILLELEIVFFMEYHDYGLPKHFVFLIPAVLLLICPRQEVKSFINSEYAPRETAIRKKSDSFAKKIVSSCEVGSNIYFVSQSDYGTHYILVKFMIRPDYLLQSIAGDDYNWCFVKNSDPDNIYFKEMNAEKWEKIIFEPEKFDYFAIMNCDDYFREEFEGFFVKENDIKSRQIYKVDHDQHKLILIDSS